MARTRQTARMSTGGPAPRMFKNDDTDQETLVGIYNQSQSRTIAVNGSDDIEIVPDRVRLSFRVSEQGDEYMTAVRSTLDMLDKAKAKVTTLGVTEESISCDSMSVKQWTHEIKEGRKKQKVTIYEPTIVLRIQLESGIIPLFGKIMISLLQLGIQNYEAPLYETTELTAFRNQARANAIKNAKEKAEIIIEGLNDTSLRLGNPITINDIFVDLQSDANSSFSSNPWYLNVPVQSRGLVRTDSKGATGGGVDSDGDEGEGDNTTITLDDQTLQRADLFSIPNICVTAYIKVIFSIDCVGA